MSSRKQKSADESTALVFFRQPHRRPLAGGECSLVYPAGWSNVPAELAEELVAAGVAETGKLHDARLYADREIARQKASPVMLPAGPHKPRPPAPPAAGVMLPAGPKKVFSQETAAGAAEATARKTETSPPAAERVPGPVDSEKTQEES